MEIINVEKTDFSRILNTAEILVREVGQVLSQDEIVKSRIKDIKIGSGRGHAELFIYFQARPTAEKQAIFSFGHIF
ncbi:hypothetical protein KAU09_05560 [Candidatus Parcubacteria bacterium]|nr:hypothetical protein [Candidatus Parcubacteria bacterium]